MMSTMIMAAAFLVIPALLGTAFCRLAEGVSGKDAGNGTGIYRSNGFAVCTGLMLMMAATELLLVFGIKQDRTLEEITRWFLLLCCGITLAAFVLSVKRIGWMFDAMRKVWEPGPYKFLLLMMLVLLFASVVVYAPWNRTDTVQETVHTTLVTGTLYQYNPLTGMEMGNGMYPVCQVMTAPLFDAVLIGIAGQDVAAAMEYVLPCLLLLLHLMVMWLHAQDSVCPGRYMVLYCLVLLFSGNRLGNYGFAMLHQGHLGNTMVIGVILPFALYLILHCRERMRWYCRLLLWGAVGLALVMNTNLTTMADLLILRNRASAAITLAVIILCGLYLLHHDFFGEKRNILRFGAAVLVMGIIGGYPFFAAWAGTELIEHAGRRGRVGAGLGLVIVLAGGVFLPARSDAVRRSRGTTGEEQVIACVSAYAGEHGGRVKMAAPGGVTELARKTDGNILLPYGKDYWIPGVNEEIGDIYDDEAYALYANMVEMESGDIDEDGMLRIATFASDTGCDILITTEELPESAFYEQIQKIDRYIVYSVIK